MRRVEMRHCPICDRPPRFSEVENYQVVCGCCGVKGPVRKLEHIAIFDWNDCLFRASVRKLRLDEHGKPKIDWDLLK